MENTKISAETVNLHKFNNRIKNLNLSIQTKNLH